MVLDAAVNLIRKPPTEELFASGIRLTENVIQFGACGVGEFPNSLQHVAQGLLPSLSISQDVSGQVPARRGATSFHLSLVGPPYGAPLCSLV